MKHQAQPSSSQALPAGKTESQSLGQILQRWERWYRLRRALRWAVSGLIFGLALALGFTLVLSGKSLLSLPAFIKLILAAGLIGAGGAFGVGFAWPVKPAQVARRFDLWFQLAERTSTALELSDLAASPHPFSNPASEQNAGAGSLAQQQLADALHSAAGVKPGQEFWLGRTPDNRLVNRMQATVLAALVFLLLATGILARPLFESAAQQQAEQAAIDEQIAALELLQETVEQATDLSPEQKQELAAALEAGVQALQESQTLEQAAAALTETQQELQKFSSAETQQLAQMLQTAGQNLANPETGTDSLQDFANNLAQGDLAGAAIALQNIPVEEMSAEELSALAADLAKAAEAVQAADPALAEQLQAAAEAAAAAAQAAQNGDAAAQAAAQAALRSALNQATAQTLADAQQVAQANQAQQLSSQIGQAGQSLNASGTPLQSGAAQNQANGSAAAGQSGAGATTGQGASQGSGQGQSGAGSGAGQGSSNSAGQTGAEAGSNPIGQNNKPGDGGETEIALFDPTRIGGAPGAEVTLPPGAAGGETVGQTGAQTGSNSQPVTGNTGAGGSGSELVWQASPERGAPLHLQTLIKRYFSLR